MAFIGGILPPVTASALTVVNTDINSNVVWGNDIYYVSRSVEVLAGVTLTIEPGTVVKFDDGARFTVSGTLMAVGTTSSRIIFTSMADDNIGGDTGGDGPSYGTPGIWFGVHFTASAGASVLAFCDLWYGGGGSGALILCSGSSPTIRDCRLRAGDTGLRCEDGASPLLERTAVDGCSGVPIATDLPSNPVFDAVVFGAEQDNQYDAIGLLGGTVTVDVELPQRSLVVGGGVPVEVSYLLLGSVTVDSMATLSFAQGVVIKMLPGVGFSIHGQLETPVSDTVRVVFTSSRDDSRGYPRDTMRDGNMSAPAAGDWDGISVAGTGSLLLRDADVMYAGTNAVGVAPGGYANIQRSTLAYGNSGLTAAASAVVDLVDCDITGHTGAGLRLAIGSDVSWTGLRALANGISAIELLPGPIAADQVLGRRTLGDWENVSYYLADGLLEVERGAALTIEPGVTLKFGSVQAGIRVRGRLLASAPADTPIVFTSLADDCTGSPRDSRSDGWNTAPCPGDWGSLDFLAGEAGSVLDGCIVRFGGGSCNGAVEIAPAAVSISHSLFEYNLGAISIAGSGLNLAPNKGAADFSTVVFRGNIIDSIARLGGVVTTDGVLTATPGLRTLFYLADDLVIPFGIHVDITPGVDIIANGAGIDVFGSLSWIGQRDQISWITGPSGGDIPGTCLDCGDPVGPGIPQVEDCEQVFGCDLAELDPLACQGTKDTSNEWGGIRFHASSDDQRSLLRDIGLSGADEPVRFEDASPRIERVVFDGMGEDGIAILGRSAPVFNECVFRNGVGVPVSASLSAQPQFMDSHFSGNGLHGLGLVSQSTTDDLVLGAEAIRSSGLGSYIALGDLHVAAGQTLTMTPGVILKFVSQATLRVDGQLRIEGNNDFDELVVLTSLSDDYWGGDSNADGGATRGEDMTWGGIDCSVLTGAATPLLRGCVVSNVWGDTAIRVSGRAALDLAEVLLVGNRGHVAFLGSGGDPTLGTISRSDFVGTNSVTAIDNPYGAFDVAATDCWWGADGGPLDASDDTAAGGLFNLQGAGCAVSDHVGYDPYTTDGSHVRLRGDASRDGRVGAFDASVVLRYLADLLSLDAEALARADANCDGSVDALDAAQLLALVAGNIASLECGAGATAAPVAAQLVYDSFDPAAQTLSLRWLGAQLPRAAQLRLRPLQSGVRITDSRLLTESGQQTASAFARSVGGDHLVFASGGELAAGTLVQVELDLAPGVDLSQALFRVEDLWVDGIAQNGLDVRAGASAGSSAPAVYSLIASPNPFNPATSIEFSVVGDAGHRVPVKIGIYDLSGRLVRTLVDESLAPGPYQRPWSGRDDDGLQAASGVYFLRLEQGSLVVNRKLTLLK